MLGLAYNYFCKVKLTMNNLSASLEDYLEIICNLIEDNGGAKAVEIAKKFNISRASVSEALSKLADKDLIIYEGHKGIRITEKGLERAKKVIQRHNTLTDFFENTLCIDKETAENNACKIEHVISDDVFERLELFQKFCRDNNDLIDLFKKGCKKNKKK